MNALHMIWGPSGVLKSVVEVRFWSYVEDSLEQGRDEATMTGKTGKRSAQD